MLRNVCTCICTWNRCVVLNMASIDAGTDSVCECWTSFHTDVADCPKECLIPCSLLYSVLCVLCLLNAF
jgi:hypothetical protein